MAMQIRARVWKFPADINTDLILPNRAFYLTPAEQARFVFSANRPGWVDLVRPGDIIVADRNFGMGSSRPAARSLRNLGIGALLAESINGLFFRNCVNFGFPAIECPGVHAAFEEGEEAEVDFATARVVNATHGRVLPGKPLPEALARLMQAGGLFPLLEKEGYVAPRAAVP